MALWLLMSAGAQGVSLALSTTRITVLLPHATPAVRLKSSDHLSSRVVEVARPVGPPALNSTRESGLPHCLGA